MLLVNVDMFSGALYAMDSGAPFVMGWGGAALAFLRNSLLESKSAALLAMLFGVGIAIQYDHAEARGVSYLPHAFRRAGALALLGLAHTLLLWNFDILLDYAVISLLVLPFMRLQGGRILWAIPALLVITVLVALPVMAQSARPDRAAEAFTMAQRYYAHGTWLEALRFRAWEFVHVAGPQRLANRLPILSPFFILGVYFWRKGLFAEPQSHVPTLRRLFVWCFVLGLVANLIPQDRLHEAVAHLGFRPLRVLIKAIAFFARPALTIGYASGLLLLMQAPAGRRVLGVLAPLGRTTLSQYLLQSVVFTLVFNGYGLGLFGLVPMNACILGGVAFFALQVWASHAWLARFRTGPVEWLWRRMTYTTTQA
ncbi:MAG: DUF418 domain-containing protein [Planctomycetota bacterium]